MFFENCSVVVYIYRSRPVVEPEMVVEVVCWAEAEPGYAAQSGGSEGSKDVL